MKDTLYYEGLVFDENITEQLVCAGKSEGVVHHGAGKENIDYQLIRE